MKYIISWVISDAACPYAVKNIPELAFVKYKEMSETDYDWNENI